MAELLIGCGNHREKLFHLGDSRWNDLTTLDIDPNCGADINWDLMNLPYSFADDNSFDEIHAYHILEHTGSQGDYRFFFAQWSEFYRILKPDGHFFGVVPAPGSVWVFGDPGHTRFVSPESLMFLDQSQYINQVGKTALADYRYIYRADFAPVDQKIHIKDEDPQYFFVLKAIKPSRIKS